MLQYYRGIAFEKKYISFDIFKVGNSYFEMASYVIIIVFEVNKKGWWMSKS